ncbi:glycosyltransferase, partial [Arthrobacter sp. GCM10027362]|uniref:glycosyltransferase n=1 Tax=Arthrobacter sp. GCM10027362 TaxID=3273379 RepID=UPI003645C717
MSTPTVSIVTPTYNCLELLQECLDSLFRQTLPQPDIEIIVVDDGSTDGTWDYLQSLRAEHPNLVALRQENSGRPSVGRNRGMAAATGEFVFFLDSDDWFAPEALERMVAAAREHGSDVVLGRMVGENRTVYQGAYEATVYDADLLRDNAWQVLGPCKLFRTSLIRRLGISFPEDMVQGEDQVFVSQCYFAARRISILADYDYHYVRGRQDGSNISRQHQTLQNKLLTTTRLAEIISANTIPGIRRYAFFRRVIFRTLAPALGTPFMAAPAEEQEAFLRQIRQAVLPNMRSKDLAEAADVPRLRLAAARRGSSAQLAELNRQLADGPAYTTERGRLYFDLGPELNGLIPAGTRQVQNTWRLPHEHEELSATVEGLAATYRLESPLFDLPGLALVPPVLELTSRGSSPVTASVIGTPLGGSRWQFVCGAELLPQAPEPPVIWDARLVLADGTRTLAASRASYPRAEDAARARAVVLLAPDTGQRTYLEAYTTASGNLSIRQGPRPRATAAKVAAYDDGVLELKLPKGAGAVRGVALQVSGRRRRLEHTVRPDGNLAIRLPNPIPAASPADSAEPAVPPFVLDIDCEHAGCQLPLRAKDGVLGPLKRPAKPGAAKPPARPGKPAP